jgi:aminotransferase
MQIASRANFSQSQIRAMSILCREKNGINMAQGLCDLDVPLPVQIGAKQAIERGYNTYTATEGNYKLRHAIAKKQNDFYDQGVDADNVLVSLGATGAFYATATSLLEVGDEVIVFEPYYGYHVATLKALGCKIRYVKTVAPSYAIDFDALKTQITPKTKAILICNPSNPSGKVYTKSELESFGELVQKHGLVFFSDEMYEHFIYDDASFYSALSIESLKDSCVVISGFSKIYSITGWRLGYAITQKKAVTAASVINDLIYVCPPAPLQMGVLKGLEELPQSYYTDVAKSHQIKRDRFTRALNQAGLHAKPIQGAYYILADISKLQGDDDKQKVLTLLDKTGIAAVPARAFYNDASGIHLARFCFSKKESELNEAMERLKRL